MENEIRYFSMFTGVGGFELGLEQANICNRDGEYKKRNEESKTSKQSLQKCNESSQREGNPTNINRGQKEFHCIGVSEIDKYSSELLKQKFPTVKNWGDCTKINPSELPDFDMLCGGFPCQAFSIAGKRRGFKDTRGTLFFEVARILEVKKPRLVFLENVKGLLNHNKGETFRVILQTLEELGYRTQWMVLNSKFFGVPQNRERIFIIGSLRGTSKPEILPIRKGNQNITEESGQENSESNSTFTATYYKGGKGIHIKMNGCQAQRVFNTDGLAPTLRGLGGGQGAKTGLYLIPYQNMLSEKTRDVEDALFVAKIIAFQENKPVQLDVMHLKHGEIRPLSTYIPQNLDEHRCLQAGEPKEMLIEPSMKIRRLTPTECERLQGFPDGYTKGFSDTQRYKMMGNAVTVNVIQAIGKKLLPSFQAKENK